MIKLFWDRDTGLVLVAVPRIAHSGGSLVVQFADARNGDDVLTSLLLDPAPAAGEHVLGAVPAVKLRCARVLVRVCAMSADWTAATEIVRQEISLHDASRDPPEDTDLWGIDPRTQALRIVRPAKPPERTGALALTSVRPFIDRPEALYQQAAEEEEEWRGLAQVFGAKGSRARLYPSTHPYGSKGGARVAVGVAETEHGLALRLSPLDDRDDWPSVDVFRLPLATLLGPGTDIADRSALGPPLQTLTLRRRRGTEVSIDLREPLDRVVLCAHDAASFLHRTMAMIRGAAAAAEKVPLEFGILQQDGLFQAVGPVYVLASYVSTLGPDVALAHALRGVVEPPGSTEFGRIGGRMCCAPVRLVLNQFRDTGGMPPDERSFLRHADRAVLPRDSEAPLRDLGDGRAVLDHLWSRLHAGAEGAARRNQADPEWPDRVLDAAVPVDLARSILLDAECIGAVRRLMPLPLATAPERFFLQVRDLAEQWRARSAEDEVCLWLKLPQRPRPLTGVDQWQDWFAQLDWARVASFVAADALLGPMRQQFPRIEPVARAAWQLHNGRESELAVFLLRTGLWMARDRDRFDIPENLAAGEGGRLVAVVARNLEFGLNRYRQDAQQAVMEQPEAPAAEIIGAMAEQAALDFWANIFAPVLGRDEDAMPDSLPTAIGNFMGLGPE